MENLLDGEDFGMMSESLMEVSGLIDDQVRIKRFVAWIGGALDGQSPTPSYRFIDMKVTVENVTEQEIFNAGGMLTVGDIKASGPIDLFEKLEGNPDTGTSPQEADVLLYQGYNWYMVGKVQRWISAGGIVYSRAMWRRT